MNPPVAPPVEPMLAVEGRPVDVTLGRLILPLWRQGDRL